MDNSFKIGDLSKNLAERVKELECLYNISRIAVVYKNQLNKAISLIINEIPNGWQFPERMGVYLEYGDFHIGSHDERAKYQMTHLDINKDLKGKLVIYFKKELNEQNIEHFLPEEQSLLNQIGHELSSLIDIDIRVKREKAIQEQLQYNDRLKLLSEITAGIAHEINTPLNNIIGYSELVANEVDSQQSKQDLSKVIKSAKHAREIVKKLMFFSCEMPSNFRLTNLNTIVKESLELMKLQITEKGIELNIQLTEELPMINMDPNQFTQVIFNLILNALDAMETGGMLTITTSHSKNDVRLRIMDNGCGISDEQLKKLFQPFYTKKRNNQGTGLGLAVSHGIVQAHGGRIEVDSTIGKGTTFVIILTNKKDG